MNFFCCYSTIFVQRLRQKPYFATQKSAAAWFFSFTQIHILIFCNSNFFSWYPWWPKYATLDYKGSKFLPADGSRGQKLGRGCMAICRPGPWVTCSTLVQLGARCHLAGQINPLVSAIDWTTHLLHRQLSFSNSVLFSELPNWGFKSSIFKIEFSILVHRVLLITLAWQKWPNLFCTFKGYCLPWSRVG